MNIVGETIVEKEKQELQQQFLQLFSIVEGMQKRINTLEESNHIFIKSQKQLIEWMDDTLEDMDYYRDNVYFEVMDNRECVGLEKFWYPKIASREETLRCIIEKGASIARFGDGEFSAIQGRIRHKFQTIQDRNLSRRLIEVLHSTENRFLIAIADNYGNLQRYTQQTRREIRHYLTRQVREEHLNLLEKDRIYYDAYITRPYVMYADNKTDAPRIRFQQLQKIWDNRDCVFVEGNMTGLGVGNDLFDNAHSIKRILGPAENAFSQYEKIFEACLTLPQDSLFLIALGPTATVLAYDLFMAGYQAIDIGHVDLEYEWYLKGEGHRTPILGKYNNEVSQGEHPVKINDDTYLAQIIADFS